MKRNFTPHDASCTEGRDDVATPREFERPSPSGEREKGRERERESRAHDYRPCTDCLCLSVRRLVEYCTIIISSISTRYRVNRRLQLPETRGNLWDQERGCKYSERG